MLLSKLSLTPSILFQIFFDLHLNKTSHFLLAMIPKLLSRHHSSLIRSFSSSPILTALSNHPPRKAAITDSSGVYTYADLAHRAITLRTQLQPNQGVAIFAPPDASFIPAILASWANGGYALPLTPLFPAAAIAPLLSTATPGTILCSSSLRHTLPPVSIPIHNIIPEDDNLNYSQTTSIDEYQQNLSILSSSVSNHQAMVFFTSGTTGPPKGVVWSHDMLDFHLKVLKNAWHWSPQDRILNVLPIHHIHGMVNVLLSALYNGAHLEMHSAFDAYSVWSAFLRDGDSQFPPTIFMAVPSIYKKLILYYEQASQKDQKRMRTAANKLRLFVCGSAALAKSDFDAWERISGQKILERYGMTETGMVLSNLYDHREQGSLGLPLPGVEIMIKNLDLHMSGELLVRGPGVFDEYLENPEATNKAFTRDRWFQTGDIVTTDQKTGHYRLLGRASSDIIKTGGYKVSALEIEEVIRECRDVADVGVVGIPDDILGQKIVAAIMPKSGTDALHKVIQLTQEKLPKYKVPRQFSIVEDLPRNILGKVQKQFLSSRLTP